MILKKAIAALASVLVTALFPLSISFSQQLPSDQDAHKTGLPELTADEIKVIERTHHRVKKVKLNALGLERVNEHRRFRGMPLLPEEAKVEDGLELATEAGLAGAIAETGVDSALEVIPPSVDNSVLPYFPPIRSQGSIGSCGSFSGTYYTMTYMLAKANGYDAKNGSDALRLSPKWTYNMVNGGADSGSWYYWCFDIGIKNGIASWQEFPYDADYRAWSLDPAVWRAAISRRFDRYGYVANTNQDSGIALVKQMLLDGYVLNFPTYINSWQYKTIGNDPATPDDDAYAGKSICYWVNGTNGYHAMTVVGYNDDIWVDINGNSVVDAGEKGAFRIANSWGTGWGEAGYRWMAYDALKNPSAVAGAPATGRILGWSPAQAHWVIARSGYTPLLLAEFTVNHAKRGQLGMTLGVSDVSRTVPSSTWVPNAIYYDGGAYAFNGGTAAVDGTFVFDFTDLAPASSGMKRFYLGARDSTALDPAQVKSFKLIDLVRGGEAVATDAPKSVDAAQAYCAVDYDFDNGNAAPVAMVSASTLSGVAPLYVYFDGSSSYDPNGSVVSYQWDFGDGVSAAGAQASHTYSQSGAFTAVLTVTDAQGATGAANAVITVAPDPNTVLAPSGLAVKASSTAITLTWADNSSNEEGFYIERALKVKGGVGAFQRIGQAGAGIKTFIDTGTRGATYYYRVQAFSNSLGKVSAYSNTASVRVK